MNHKSISWSHEQKFVKLPSGIYQWRWYISVYLSRVKWVRLNDERTKISFFTNQYFFLNSNPGLNYTIHWPILIVEHVTRTNTNCRSHLYEAQSKLKPIWNLKPLWIAVVFTWQFHCSNFPNHNTILFQMCKW